MKIKQPSVIRDNEIITFKKVKGGNLSLKLTKPVPIEFGEEVKKIDVKKALPKKKFVKVKKISILEEILKKREKKDLNKSAITIIEKLKKSPDKKTETELILKKDIDDLIKKITDNLKNKKGISNDDKELLSKNLNAYKALTGKVYIKTGSKLDLLIDALSPPQSETSDTTSIPTDFFDEPEITTEVEDDKPPKPIASMVIPPTTPAKKKRIRKKKVKLTPPTPPPTIEEDENDEFGFDNMGLTGKGIELETLPEKQKEVIYLLLTRLENIQFMPKKNKTKEIIDEYETLKNKLEKILKTKWNFDIDGNYITGGSCFNCLVDMYELDDDEFIDGKGFRKFLTNIRKKVFGLRPSIYNPPKFEDMLKKYGNDVVKQLTIIRTPINKALSTLVNIITLGALKKEMKDKGHDNFYHLQLLINNKLSLEKNEVISLTECKKCITKTSQTLIIDIEDIPAELTINDMISNTRKEMGDLKFTAYDPLKNNCQNFIYNVLKANDIDKAEYNNFILQSTDDLIKNTPSLSQKFLKKITDVAAYTTRITQGGKVSCKRGRPKKI